MESTRDKSFTKFAISIIGLTALVFIVSEGLKRKQDGRLNRLTGNMRSTDKMVALEAVAELRRTGQLYDGSLRGQIIAGGNLSEVDLAGADLRGAWLDHTKLHGANLKYANLVGADLRKSNLNGADLRGAYLAGCNLRDVKLDKNTRLPNGSNWSRTTNIAVFTDVGDPEFWQPLVPYSYIVDQTSRVIRKAFFNDGEN